MPLPTRPSPPSPTTTANTGTGTPIYLDMTYDASNLSFVHDLTESSRTLKGRLNFGYTRYDFTGMTVDNYEATTGFEYAIQEKWTFLLDGGARYTDSSFQREPPGRRHFRPVHLRQFKPKM